MRLYHLTPIATGLWDPWYDKAFGFVVRAQSEHQARTLASNEAGDEGPDVWLSVSHTRCEVLEPAGEPGVIVRDFASA